MGKKISNSAKDTEKIAQEFVNNCLLKSDFNRTRVVALLGDLGSGKTTFTQFLARTLGIKDKITSPTFVLMKKYDLSDCAFKKLVHIDAYRLQDEKDLDLLGFKEILEKEKAIVLIEWADRVKKALPQNHISIKFEHLGKDQRSIDISLPK